MQANDPVVSYCMYRSVSREKAPGRIQHPGALSSNPVSRAAWGRARWLSGSTTAPCGCYPRRSSRNPPIAQWKEQVPLTAFYQVPKAMSTPKGRQMGSCRTERARPKELRAKRSRFPPGVGDGSVD